jgi:uncharacterized membrane protein
MVESAATDQPPAPAGGSHILRLRPPTPESVSRLVNFTDAVVAIAITLLILPILDIAAPEPGQTIFDVMGEHRGQFFAFLLSFIVVLGYWRRNHDLLNGLKSYTPRLVLINSWWLIGIVFLQFPTEQIGLNSLDRGFSGGVGTLYFTTLAVTAALSVLEAAYLRRHPELLEHPEDMVLTGHDIRMPLEIGYMVLLAVIYWFFPLTTPWLVLGLGVFGTIDRWEQARARRAAKGTPHQPTVDTP